MDQLMNALNQLILFVFPNNCFEELLMRFNIFHGECTRMVLSRVLGIGIIAGSVLVKLPQILKIWSARSGKGVAIFSQLLELYGVTASMAYSVGNKFPFSAWGEALFLIVQSLILCNLILLFDQKGRHGALLTAFYAIACYLLLSGITPLSVLTKLQMSTIPSVIVARFQLIQITQNYRAGSTGQLSIVTMGLIFIGALARIFTSVQETGDTLLVVTYLITSSLSGIIVAQIIYYWSSTGKQKLT